MHYFCKYFEEERNSFLINLVGIKVIDKMLKTLEDLVASPPVTLEINDTFSFFSQNVKQYLIHTLT
jgi:hypothetical protein